MSFWDSLKGFAVSAVRSLPPCHICGAPGVQLCRACGRVACHIHAYSNVGMVKSICSVCVAQTHAWATEDLQVGQPIPDGWPYAEPPWQILGIDPNAEASEIRRAQRDISRTIHPDTSSGDNERQVAVNRAADEMLRMRSAA